MTTVHSEQNKPPYEDIMEINHCREGRFECEFADGGAAYLGAGDLAANMLTHTTRDSWFPLSHYHGISVLVDLRAAQDTLCQISQIFGCTPIDLYALRDRLCRGDHCFIIRDIRAYLVEHLDQHITLPELSARFDIPLTTMKQNFKTVYGDTIGTYIHSYRMQKAMWLLQETDQTITEIAAQVGYQNASKFSEIFRQFAGETPSEYRKIPRPIGAESVLSEWQKI
jgi:AraC-like DNA-binding protein